MIIKLLTFGWLGTEQGTTRKLQIRAFKIKITIYEEIFLLGAGKRIHLLAIFMAKKSKDTFCLGIESLIGTQ